MPDLAGGALDFIQYFTTERAALDADFAMLKAALRPAGMLWVSWPKRAAKVPTDLDENIVRAIGLDHGLVDICRAPAMGQATPDSPLGHEVAPASCLF